ncbi:hypothetical protein OKW38_003172 [Paraburkholderia sp. MM5496-R1]
MAVVSHEVDESPGDGAFLLCAEHAQQLGGVSPLSNLMVVKAWQNGGRPCMWEGSGREACPYPDFAQES